MATPSAYQKITDFNTEFLRAYPMHHLFQDSAGTLPLYAIGQPCGLVLDQGSGGVVLGAELVTNGGFDSDTGWIKGTGWSIAGGVGVATAAPASSNLLSTSFATVVGNTYQVTATFPTVSAGSASIIGWSGSANIGTSNAVTASGATARCIFKATTTVTQVYATVNTLFTGTIDNISVREVIGSHASQSTTTKRPILGARYNLLTATEDFSNAAWAKNLTTATANTVTPSNTAGSHGIAQVILTVGVAYTAQCKFKSNGYIGACISNAGSSLLTSTLNMTTGVITSGASITSATAVLQSDGYWLLTCSFVAAYTTLSIFVSSNGTTTNNFTGDAVSGIFIKEAQCKPANSPQNIPAYQRVTSATDYDTAGFPARLVWDGVDDCLVVPVLDLSSTDKVTVIAGVTKLSDAALGVICELSSSSSTTVGTFSVWNGDPGSVAGPTWAMFAKGTAIRGDAVITGFASPVSAVLTGMADTATLCKVRGNAGGFATDTTNKGTGNFSSNALYIGQRGAASLPFNGSLQSLTVIGNLLPDGEVKLLEDLTNKAMGKVY